VLRIPAVSPSVKLPADTFDYRLQCLSYISDSIVNSARYTSRSVIKPAKNASEKIINHRKDRTHYLASDPKYAASDRAGSRTHDCLFACLLHTFPCYFFVNFSLNLKF